ncbi:hypothetical protein E4U42_002484 [Claviceps africana]|uniref:Transcriptional regulator n=1 Tax=Claviceps africana TaxID=83212 RepID=A0A8K0JF94_9HYPO|nr:hypothetical protein E4U42_002484 [Claviceps africana]
MVPSHEKLEAALIEGTYHIFTSEPDATTVNKVRKHVEEEQGLEAGFFANDEWKQKSKAVIKEYVDKLLDGWEPEPKPKQDANSENGIKRHAAEDESSSPKRRKQGSKKNKDGAKPPKRRDNTGKTTKPQPSKSASRRKTQDVQPAEEADHGLDSTKKASSPPEGSDNDALSSTKADVSKTLAGEESEEYSDVIDEGPKPKRKKKEPKHESSKPSKPPVAKKSTTTITDNPQEAEIKKLQSQLVKCGIRKLWHNELKQYKDDSRAKIRHLKKMLADIGMDGRFSEAKAREIKETREILADVDAAQEMNALWGMGSGRRAGRGKHKSAELDDSEDGCVQMRAVKNGGKDDDEDRDDGRDDDDDDEEQATSFAARRRRAQADLAFLGDESESN